MRVRNETKTASHGVMVLALLTMFLLVLIPGCKKEDGQTDDQDLADQPEEVLEEVGEVLEEVGDTMEISDPAPEMEPIEEQDPGDEDTIEEPVEQDPEQEPPVEEENDPEIGPEEDSAEDDIIGQDTAEEPAQVTHTPGHTGCLGDVKEDIESFEAVAGPEGGVRLLHHLASHNCCVETIALSVRATENHFVVEEQEIAPNPCNCICDYDVWTDLGALAAGTYTVEWWVEGAESGSFAFTVDGQGGLIATRRSECMDGAVPADSNDDEYPEGLEIEVDGSTLHIHHANAMHNCCTDYLYTSYELAAQLLTVTEFEITSEPCRCTCPFDVDSSLYGLADGSYTLRYEMEDERLVGEIPFTIPGNSVRVETAHSECLGPVRSEPVEEQFSARTGPEGSVRLRHLGGIHNCCAAGIALAVDLDGFQIALDEREIVGEPCDCVCPYDVHADLFNLPAGEYTVNWSMYGQPATDPFSFTISEDGALVTSRHSGCLSGGVQKAEEPAESLEVTVVGDTASILHHNVQYNCCLDQIAVSVTQEAWAITITETEMTTNPCFCICPFDVETEIAGLAVGAYTLRYYADGGARLVEERGFMVE